MKKIIGLLLFIEAFQPSIDPDLGWHLRYGQYFWETGHVLRDNIISIVWPWYHWVQASWGYDLVAYQIFTHSGFFGLAVSSATLTLATFLIATWPHKRLSPLQFFFLAIVFMSTASPIWAAGMRTPTLSTPFMALAIVLAGTGHLVLLPLLFLVWANLHGGFALGLILLTAAEAVQLVVLRTFRKSYWIVLAASWLTPLMNPWGFRIYEETFKHSSNVNLNIISEWLPLTTFPIEAAIVGIYVIFTAIVVFWRRDRKTLPDLAMLGVASILTYFANRFAIVLGVLIVYLLAKYLSQVSLPILKRRAISIGLWIFLIGIIPFDMFVAKRYFQPPTAAPIRFTWNDYCATTLYCDEVITTIMRKNPPKGNGFHPYNYGGYLSWRVPEVKTFIDGRMAAWEENGKTPPTMQGDWVFMQKGPVAFINFDNQYHFTWIIVPTQSDVTDYLNDLAKNRLWTRVYSDKNYSYFIR